MLRFPGTALMRSTEISKLIFADTAFATNAIQPQDTNPFTFATWSFVNTNGHLDGQKANPLIEDPETVIPIQDSKAWILGHESTDSYLGRRHHQGARPMTIQRHNSTYLRCAHSHTSFITPLANADILASLSDNSQDLTKT